jgi:hypothetical protein
VVANVDPLSVAALLAAANEVTGLTDLGEDGWEEGLDRLLHSLRAEADLNEIGVQVATASLLGALEDRRRHRPCAGRDRRTTADGHDDLVRPARSGRALPGAAHVGGGAAAPAA